MSFEVGRKFLKFKVNKDELLSSNHFLLDKLTNIREYELGIGRFFNGSSRYIPARPHSFGLVPFQILVDCYVNL